jgi:hypothetical protein
LNYILHLGLIKQHKIELFKRTRKVKPDDGTSRLKNITEFYISSYIRQSTHHDPPATTRIPVSPPNVDATMTCNAENLYSASTTIHTTPPPPLRRSNRLTPSTQDSKSLLVSDYKN